MSPNERYEYMANLFFKETGMLAPGKDDPIGGVEPSLRQSEWELWVEVFYSNLFILHKNQCCP